MDNSTVKEELRQYILEEFLPGEKASNLLDDTPLRTGGVLDSVANLTLVTHVEEHYHVEVEAHEAGVENFDTINRIAALIESKGGAVS